MYEPPFEIHVHGDIPLSSGLSFDDVANALQPLWSYVNATCLQDAQASSYEEEPGIVVDLDAGMLKICWTIQGDESFKQILEECCMALNELASEGAALEVSFYDAKFDEEESEAEEADDDFLMMFIGPTPAAILTVQRNLLVQDVVGVMERHFEASELGRVVQEIDRLFERRFDNLVNSLQFDRPPKGSSGGGRAGRGRNSGDRPPKHLH